MAIKATIYDVASLAGVSIATVSRVLNSPRQVAESSRKKVSNAMRELSFVPKAEASARARKDFKRVGVLLPFFTAPPFTHRLRSIAGALSSADYELITYSVESQEQLSGYLSMLPVSGRIDGLIIIALPVSEEEVKLLKDYKLPTVLVEISHPDFCSIEIDNFKGGQLAAEYLISKGYRNLGFIGVGGEPPYSLHATDHRLAGFKNGLETLGVELHKENIVFHKYGMEHSVECSRKMLAEKNPVKAVFTASDLEAVGVIKAAREMGLKVPEDIAVIGFDDIDLADYMGITTINQSLDQSGKTAVELLVEHMKNPETAVKHISYQLKIVERYSA
ncbi:MAG: LacI family DNA-binding transcriptional regulator [Spirochaetota bacterium]|nr:LacI family DNA-binding transcriptional regulator [Spirochaetota bacterium]